MGGMHGRRRGPLMTRENILTMMADGFRFGGHGRTHKKLIATSEEEARDEVQQRRKSWRIYFKKKCGLSLTPLETITIELWI